MLKKLLQIDQGGQGQAQTFAEQAHPKVDAQKNLKLLIIKGLYNMWSRLAQNKSKLNSYFDNLIIYSITYSYLK